MASLPSIWQSRARFLSQARAYLRAEYPDADAAEIRDQLAIYDDGWQRGVQQYGRGDHVPLAVLRSAAQLWGKAEALRAFRAIGNQEDLARMGGVNRNPSVKYWVQMHGSSYHVVKVGKFGSVNTETVKAFGRGATARELAYEYADKLNAEES